MNMIKCFTILEEIKSTLPKSFLQSLFTNQMKCWFLMRGENRSTRGKTSHSRVENQQTQSTYDIRCGNRTRATLVEGKCSHHSAHPEAWCTWLTIFYCILILKCLDITHLIFCLLFFACFLLQWEPLTSFWGKGKGQKKLHCLLFYQYHFLFSFCPSRTIGLRKKGK